MFTVWDYEDEMVFEGTLEECEAYVLGFEEEYYIEEPDGFTVH